VQQTVLLRCAYGFLPMIRRACTDRQADNENDFLEGLCTAEKAARLQDSPYPDFRFVR
jgi:hypothetical protein